MWNIYKSFIRPVILKLVMHINIGIAYLYKYIDKFDDAASCYEKKHWIFVNKILTLMKQI